METDKTVAQPQFVLAIFGLTLLMLSWLGFAAVPTADSPAPTSTQGSRLQVVPSHGAAPSSVIDQLQGAGGLQGQETQGLQRPIGEQLQPNAKTGNLNGTRPIQ